MSLLPLRLVGSSAPIASYTFLEDATLVGILVSNEDTTSEGVILLNGKYIVNIAQASGSSQDNPNPVFIPLKISIKKGFTLSMGGTTWAMFYFS